MPTKYLQPNEMPKIGTFCPNCGQGPVQQGNWGPWCPLCKTGFKQSTYPPRPQQGYPPQSPQMPSNAPQSSDNLIRGLGVLRGDIKALKEEIIDRLNMLTNAMMPEEIKQDPPANVKEEDIPIIEDGKQDEILQGKEQLKQGMSV